MRIINKVTEKSYTQWIEKYVKDVLKHSGIKCGEVVIEDIEWSLRIFLTIDGEEYGIRTWTFGPVKWDKYGNTCAENVPYTLFKYVDDENGSHGIEIDEGNFIVKWTN